MKTESGTTWEGLDPLLCPLPTMLVGLAKSGEGWGPTRARETTEVRQTVGRGPDIFN